MFKKMIVLCGLYLFSSVVAAQSAVVVYGNENQPGSKLHSKIVELIDQGSESDVAVASAVETYLQADATLLGAEAKAAVAFDTTISEMFMSELVESNSLIETVKVITEMQSENAAHIVFLGVKLYPDFAQDVVDGASLAGVLSPEDALIAAIQAGAAPNTVSSATAAGEPVVVSIPPLGVGVGAGGTGGGDTTISSN